MTQHGSGFRHSQHVGTWHVCQIGWGKPADKRTRVSCMPPIRLVQDTGLTGTVPAAWCNHPIARNFDNL